MYFTFCLLIVLQGVFWVLGHDELEYGYILGNDQFDESALIWCFFFIIICVVKTLLIKYKLPIRYTVFAIFGGFIAGVLVNEYKYRKRFEDIRRLDFLYPLFFYVPGVLYKTAFCLDTYIIMRSLVQIIIIAIPISLLTGGLVALMMLFVIETSWSWHRCLLFGILLTPVYSAHTERYLKQLAVHMKHTSSLLDGESVIAVITCFWAYSLTLGILLGFLGDWYLSLVAITRMIVFGTLLGYIFGLVGQLCFKKMYTAQIGVVLFSFGLPFFTFALTEIYFGGCGAVSVLILGAMMAKERTSLSPESEQLLLGFWKAIEVLLDTLMCFIVGIKFAKGVLHLTLPHYVYSIVIYLLYYIFRFLLFLLFAPVLSRLGYGMNFKTMLICVVGGLKSPFCFIFGIILTSKLEFVSEMDRVKFDFYNIWVYLLSYLINGTLIPCLLKAMGITQISVVKQISMNNCMKHIFSKRQRMISVLKQNKYLSDANWPLVSEVTFMKHPDKVGNKTDEDDEEEDFFIGYRYTFCADCKKEVADEPTKKELREMTKEAKMRILKAKNMSYIRQYENGMVSKEGIRLLTQAVELAMDSKDGVIRVEDLYKKFDQESRFRRFVRKRMELLSQREEDTLKRPKTYWRRICYKIIRSPLFDIFIYFVIIINAGTIISNLLYDFQVVNMAFNEQDHLFYSLNWLFFLIYLLEFVIKIMAYSRNSICKDGFPTYFKATGNKIDFAVLIIFVATLALTTADIFIYDIDRNHKTRQIRYFLDICKLLRLIRLFYICKVFYPKIIHQLDSAVDANMASTYELGKAYVIGEEEILKLIPQIIDHVQIQDELKAISEKDKVLVSKLLGIVQKERPWIAITVKTKQVIRTIINNMRDAVIQLKVSGWTDLNEQKRLMDNIQELYKGVNAIKYVNPCAPEVIFKEVSWMANDQKIFDFLFENVTVKTFEPGDVVFGQGKVADGIYVVVTGMFVLNYVPETYFLNSLNNFGILPIADYVSCVQYYENVTEYIVSGNCMGELSSLTGRSYNCTITADAHSQVYVLSHGVIKRAMELSPDFINGLECRIWKSVSVRIAEPLLMTVPTYHTSNLDQIKIILERSFMPDLKHYKIFTVTDMIQDILLIEGVARDFHTRQLFLGPCYIPRTVQKIILPASSLIDIPINMESRLLIIPEQDVDEFDVMFLAEETCEMVAAGSEVKCLQHLAQNISSRLRRRNKGRVQTTLESRSSGRSASRYTATTEAESFIFKNKASDIGSAMVDLDEEELRSHGYERNQGKSQK